MNHKIILATSKLSDAELLFSSITDLIAGCTPLIVEASISDQRLLETFPDMRTIEEATELMFSNTQRIHEITKQKRIPYIKRDYNTNNYLRDLIAESRYADLIVCTDRFYSNVMPAHTLNSRIQCALLLMPEKIHAMMPYDLFLYDGSVESIQAIKSFTYLFPNRSHKELLVYGWSIKSASALEMEAWLCAHYQGIKLIETLPAGNDYNLIGRSYAKMSLQTPHFIQHA